MTPREAKVLAACAAVAIVAATLPWIAGDYGVSFGINLLQFAVMATAWGMFSGPTRLVSLATVAFFGVGAYTVAVAGEALPWVAVLALAAGLGVALALAVGFATLRLSGVYFVVFTFGLAELVKQLVTWYEVNVTRTLGRYVFLDVTQREIYLQLLLLLALALFTGWRVRRSRLGLALRVIGADETVARHIGINTAVAKQALFAISAGFIALTGAIVAPRWTYIDPVIAFSPTISFEVVIMALLGGAARLFGPLAGVVPLVILFEVLSARFPNTFSILLGVTFMAIVYFLPAGVIGWIERLAPEIRRGGRIVTLLSVAGVTRRFGGLVAVNDLSFAIEPGEVVGLIGPNGSGKTTALNLISGALAAHAGSVVFRGQELAGLPAHRIARLGMARTFQLVRVLGGMTCRENVEAGLAFHPGGAFGRAAHRRAEALLERVGLTGRAEMPADDLAYVDCKRLELARALALSPSLLLLDEWLAGLNPTELDAGIALVRSLTGDGVAVLLVEHVMDAVHSLCGRCIVMSAGRKIAEGATALALADPEVVRAYLGYDDAGPVDGAGRA